MTESNPTSETGALGRKGVGDLLRRAFDHVATHDYGFKYTDNEEDIRACLYHRVRQMIDFDPHWRVFLSLQLKSGPESEEPDFKPDLCFMRSKSLSFKKEEITIELLVELKNWPSEQGITDDLQKLKRYSEWCKTRGQPDLYFAAILGGKKEKLLARIRSEVNRLTLAQDNVLVRHHSELYRGPWHKGYGDPWKAVANGT